MCSILGILGLRTNPAHLGHRALELSGRMRHRGPDWSGIFADEKAILALYAERGAQFLEDLNGIIAFVLYDQRRGRFLEARDPIGVMPRR